MAQRRMFSLKIINSARFLKMPLDAQNLYFHLSLRADDDGVVEAWSAMRLVGGAEDSLKLLHAKGFIHILNEDLVTFITDWREHNHIRADRKVDSLYKNLLVEIIPDIKYLEPKQRADRQKAAGTSQGQPKDSIGKDRLGKERLGKERREESPVLEIDKVIEKSINHWNTKTNLPKCRYTIFNLPKIAEIKTKFTVFAPQEVEKAIDNLSEYYDKEAPKYRPASYENFITRSLDRWVDDAHPGERYKKTGTIKTEFEAVEW